MKPAYLYALFAALVLLSCDPDAAAPGSTTDSETDSGAYIGTWESFFGDRYVLTSSTYERALSFMGEVTYQDRGSLTATATTLTITREFVKPDGTGDWLSADFNAQFERDRLSWNEYLASFELGPVNADEYWDIHYTWANDELEGGTSGSPYDGLEAGMTLEEYKVSAMAAFTASLTEIITWSVSGNELELITVDGPDRFARL